jgi:hypothetical protein
MNSYQWTRQEVATQFSEAQTFGDLFRQIELELGKKNQVVCQFKINGLTLNEDTEKRLRDSGVQDIDLIEVLGQAPGDIMSGILKNWCVEIPKMLDINDRLSQDLRFQGVEGRMKPFVSLIDSCQLLVDSLMSIDHLLATTVTVQTENWKKAEQLTASSIGQALQAFQKKDFTLLADVLEYDLGHSLQSWQELVGQLMVELKNDKDAGISNSVMGG